MCMYVYRYIHVCDRYCDIDTCIMYVKCVLFNNLSNIQMYFMCPMYLSSSQRSLWSLQLLAWTLWCQQYRFPWVPHLCRHIWRLPGILCLLAWLFSLMFAVSHARVCVLSLLLAETPYDFISYPFILLMPSPLSLWHHRCMAYMSCNLQLQLLTLEMPVHTEERASSLWESLKWSFMGRQDRLC